MLSALGAEEARAQRESPTGMFRWNLIRPGYHLSRSLTQGSALCLENSLSESPPLEKPIPSLFALPQAPASYIRGRCPLRCGLCRHGRVRLPRGHGCASGRHEGDPSPRVRRLCLLWHSAQGQESGPDQGGHRQSIRREGRMCAAPRLLCRWVRSGPRYVFV